MLKHFVGAQDLFTREQKKNQVMLPNQNKKYKKKKKNTVKAN